MIELKDEGKAVNIEVLDNILNFFVDNIDEVIKMSDFKEFFGILINLMIIDDTMIDKMIDPLG